MEENNERQPEHNNPENGDSSLTLLVEAAGSKVCESTESRTKMKAEQVPEESLLFNSPAEVEFAHSHSRVTSATTKASSRSIQDKDGIRETVLNNMGHPSTGKEIAETIGIDDTRRSLVMLASAASLSEKQGNLLDNATDRESKGTPEDYAQTLERQLTKQETNLVQAATDTRGANEEKTLRTSLEDSEALKKKALESKRVKAAMLETAKSLSKDPLVQLSMFRAMQQQRTLPDQVQKNRLEREKAQAKKKPVKRRRTATKVAAKRPPQDLVRERIKVPRQREASALGSAKQTGRRLKPGQVTPQCDVHSALRQVTVQQEAATVIPPAALPRGPLESYKSQAAPPAAVLGALNQQLRRHDGQNGPQRSPTMHQLQQQGLVIPQASSGPQGQNQMLTTTLALLQSMLTNLQCLQGAQVVLPNQVQQPPIPQHLLSQATQGINGAQNAASLELLKSLGRHSLSTLGQISVSETPKATPDSIDRPGKGILQVSEIETRSLTNEAEQNQRSGKKVQPGRIPCRARGTPHDHNFQNAHFVVSKQAVHGEGLVCSFSKSRDSGVKFLFCFYCRIPVAKRNFRLRHNHGGAAAAQSGDRQVPSTICVASDSASASRLPGSVSASRDPSGGLPPRHDAQVAYAMPCCDKFTVAPKASRKDRKRKKLERPKHRSSEKKRKHSKQKRVEVEGPGHVPVTSVPLTIQISSDRAQAKVTHNLEDVDVKANQAAPADKQTKSKKRAKHSGSRKRNRCKHRHTDDGSEDLAGETPSPMLAAGADSKMLKRSKRKTGGMNPIIVEDSTDSNHNDTSIGQSSSPCVNGDDYKAAKKIGKKRLILWSGLLGERPPRHDDASMSKWLMSVLAVSDLKAPLKEDI